MNMAKKLVCFTLIMFTAFGTTTLVSPKNIVLTDGVNFLGDVGPGQTIDLVFSRGTGITGEERAIFWHSAESDKVLGPSTLQGDELLLQVRVPTDLRGAYSFSVTMRGSEVGLIQPETYDMRVNIKENIFDFTYSQDYTINAAETKNISVVVRSSSIADDTLIFEDTEGIPSGWLTRGTVEVPALSEKIVLLGVTPLEEGYYKAKINVGRESSSIVDPVSFNIRAYPTLNSKLESFGEGFSIVPYILQPFYSLLSWLGSLFYGL